MFRAKRSKAVSPKVSERTALAATLAAGLAAALSGCGDEDAMFVPPLVAGCEAYAVEACFVQERECQENLLGLVSCLRGQPPPPLPAIETLTMDELGDVPPPAPTPEEEALHWALERLELLDRRDLSPEAREARAEATIAAFYRPSLETIYLVSDLDASGDVLASILVHELVHYLQDRRHDLLSFLSAAGSSYDGRLAALSVVEGDASLHDAMFLAATWGLDPRAQDYRARFAAQASGAEERLELERSAWLHSPGIFPYNHGARWIAEVHAAGGLPAIDARFSAPPDTTLEIMVGEAGDRRPPRLALRGYERVIEDRLGAWLVRTLLRFRAQGAAGYVSDRLQVFRAAGPVRGRALTWLLEAEDPTTADALARALRGAVRANVRVHAGRLVVVTHADFDIAGFEAEVDRALGD